MQKGRLISILLLIIGLALLSFTGYLFWQNKRDKATAVEAKAEVEQLTKEIASLETEVLELEVIFKSKEDQIDQRDELLKQKYQAISALEQKIDELKRSKQVDQATIRKLEDRLNKIKNEYIIRLQAESDFRLQRAQQLERQADSIQSFYDARIAALEKELVRKGLQVPVAPVEERQPLSVGLLTAANFEFFSLNKENASRKGVSFSPEELNQVRICFEILRDPNVAVDNYDLFVVYKNPDGTVAINDDSGIVNIDGLSVGYSFKKTVYFTGEKKKFVMTFPSPQMALV